MALITGSVRGDRLLSGPRGGSVEELKRWADEVTELLGREVMPVLALLRDIVNARHGLYELIEASGTIGADTEYLRVSGSGLTLTLPSASTHKGPIFFTGSASWTAEPAGDDTVDGGASASLTTGVLVSDGTSEWRSI